MSRGPGARSGTERPTPEPSGGPGPARTRWTRGDARGQTVLDYAVGVGIFLVAVTFVLGIIPGMFAPFEGGTDAQTADRYAQSLSADRLGTPERPYVLNETCTGAFFVQLQSDDDDAPTSCRYDTTADDLETLLGAGPGIDVNVTIETLSGSPASLTTDGTTVSLQAGQAVPNNQGITTARRIVRLDGESYRFLVRVW